MGGEVIEDTVAVEPEPEPVVERAVHRCEVCNKDLSGENSDLVTLAYIKLRKKLCNEDFAKQGGPVPAGR